MKSPIAGRNSVRKMKARTEAEGGASRKGGEMSEKTDCACCGASEDFDGRCFCDYEAEVVKLTGRGFSPSESLATVESEVGIWRTRAEGEDQG